MTEDKIRRCPECGSDKVSEILLEDMPFTKENVDKLLGLLDRGLLNQRGSKLECEACGHKWTNPKHLEEALNKAIKEGKFKESDK